MSPTRALIAAGLALIVALSTGCAGVVVGGAAASASAASDRRTAGSLIDDQLIELKATQFLHEDEALANQVHANFTSYNGLLLISGEAPTESLKLGVTNLVSNIPKVRQVYNELTLAAPSTLLSRSNDTYLSAKVKTALIADEYISAHSVKVVSESGTVFLMGLVTRSEADRVTQVVRQVKGVQRVVKLFEYIS